MNLTRSNNMPANNISKPTIIATLASILILAGCAHKHIPTDSIAVHATRGPSSRVAAPENAKENFLKSDHEQRLDKARMEEAVAKTALDKAWAMQRVAAALNSLGRSEEALLVIDQALKVVDPSKSQDLIATKAGILFSLNEPQAALTLLAPKIEKTRQFADSKPQLERAAALGIFTEGFITATFAHIQLEQWRDAIITLADAHSPLEGPKFYAYRSLVYRYIMSRAHDPSLGNARLEQEATYYAAHDKGHYGALLRMWQGEDTVKEIATAIAEMSGADQQEAFGEALFYGGAYAKFVKGNAVGGSIMLDRLNRLAPYGSIEWIYGKRVLQ
jgi:tetratricopeptide (TPR) repeat protein